MHQHVNSFDLLHILCSFAVSPGSVNFSLMIDSSINHDRLAEP